MITTLFLLTGCGVFAFAGNGLTSRTVRIGTEAGKMLAEEYGAVVVSPNYRLAGKAPYPAALDDCYAALEWMYGHADELGIDRNRIVVGGESAGGGLAVAVCLHARDKGEIPIALQLPLYPMPDSKPRYPGNVHAFDMLQPCKKESKAAKARLCGEYERIFCKYH